MSVANPARGESALTIGDRSHVLRPSFAALVAAEEELGPLLALIDRAADGRISLSEIATLFWHCLAERDSVSRDALGETVVAAGLARVTPMLRSILQQILAGAG